MHTPPRCTLAILAALPLTANAQFHEGDIAINIDSANNRILVGDFDADAPFRVIEDCIFTADLNSSGITTDPGFDSPTGMFPTNASGGIDFLSALRVWNGTSFDTIPDERIGVSFGPLVENLTPLTDTETLGSYWGNVNSQGEFHNHFAFTLLDPARDGIYLAHMRLTFTPPADAQSDPFWMVFAKNVTQQELDAAADYARNTLSTCPDAPTADLTTDGTNPGDPGYGEPDGAVTVSDLTYYVEFWISGDLTVADVTTDGTNPGDASYGIPDGSVTVIDLTYFVELWISGTP
ncbi:MAG: GC-type dockerin domain-anchored protein [Planctomycetota bacterium]